MLVNKAWKAETVTWREGGREGQEGQEGGREGGREGYVREVHFLGEEFEAQADGSRGHALGGHGDRDSGGAAADLAEAGGD